LKLGEVPTFVGMTAVDVREHVDAGIGTGA
jgi:hypothetical protein